jgi:diguanylate cyclase (GGDEF)-like protein
VWLRLLTVLSSKPALLALLFTACVASGAFGVAWAIGPPGIPLVSLPTGFALGGFLIFGHRIWPVVFAAFIVVAGWSLGVNPAVPLVAAGHTIEPLLAAYLVNRYANGLHALQGPRSSVRFVGLVTLAACTSSATMSAIALVVSGDVAAGEYGSVFLSQALASTTGTLLVTPPLVLLSRGRPRPTVEQILEGCAAFVAVAGTGLIGFYRFPVALRGFPVELLLMPVLLWPALRLGRRATSMGLLVLAALAVGGTLEGYGPFIRSTPDVSMAVVRLFILASAALTLSLSALSSEFEVAESQLRELVVTDPLTGLPNYRRLLEVLEKEIDRASRLSRSFAVVFFDMDDLKRINDELGHLTGSRAVCRFAETLKAALRDSDTAARYGGDEFVAVLPDTGDDGAELVLTRMRSLLAGDTAQPALGASAGVAVYPRDGRTPTTLLSAADRALYANKAQKARRRRGNLVDLQTWTSAS